jgi:hypothetical protein
MQKCLRLTCALVVLCGVAMAQQTAPPDAGAQGQGPPRERRNPPAGESVMGKISAISGDTITVARAAGGDAMTVKVGESTRFFKDREPIKLQDLKVGDSVFARGQINGNNLQAMMVALVTPEMMQRMQQGGFRPGGGAMFIAGDLGKTVIIGEVLKIDGTTLTIHRPDNQDQQIEVDENTSFRKQRESITLPDVKVGDTVMGRGELKNNVFVPATLNVLDPQMVEQMKQRMIQMQQQQQPK